MSIEKHETNCCGKHGCYFSTNRDCPVYSGGLTQRKACDKCIPIHDIRLEIERLQREFSWSTELENSGIVVSPK